MPHDPPAGTAPLERWNALRPVDRAVYGVVVVLVLLAAGGAPVWQALDVPLALGIAHEEEGEAARDRWGRPLIEGTRQSVIGAVPVVWSAGPNGVDERGRGDDVVALAADHPRRAAHRTAPVALLLLGLGLAGGWAFLGFLYQPRSDRLTRELARAAALAIPGGALLSAVGIGLVLVVDRPNGPLQTLREQLVIPLPLAVAGSGYVLSYLAVLWIRLGQPLEGAEADEIRP